MKPFYQRKIDLYVSWKGTFVLTVFILKLFNFMTSGRGFINNYQVYGDWGDPWPLILVRAIYETINFDFGSFVARGVKLNNSVTNLYSHFCFDVHWFQN